MSSFLSQLRSDSASVVTVELRPPRAELESAAGIDAWIDSYHTIRSLTRQGVRVLVTDNAVGAQEENNLRHLVTNLGQTVAREQVIPFLTTKHSLEFCLEYVDQAVERGFTSLVILGGDKHVGRPRCVEHAWQLRKLLRARHPALELGGWANPAAEARSQVRYLLDENAVADFFLTQVVSHHRADAVRSFLGESSRARLPLPGVFGVFYYRSANLRTLQMLRQFLPVPVDALVEEFAGGATPAEICARTLRLLIDLGARHFYISNLPLQQASRTLNEILEQAGLFAAPTTKPPRH